MKNMLLVSLAVVFIYASCDKNNEGPIGPVSVSGKVLSRHTNEIQPHCQVLVRRLHKDEVGALYMQTVTTTQADMDANYTITWNAEKDYKYFITAKGNTLYFDADLDQIDFTKSKNVIKDLLLPPKGWVRYELINEIPLDRADIDIAPDGPNCYGVISDTAIYKEGEGGWKTKIGIFIRTQSGSKNYSDSIIFPILDTFNYSIKF